MSLKRTIAHNTVVQIIGKIISTILGALAFFLLARYLGAEQFGWYTTTISFLGFAGVLIDFGLIPVTAQLLSEPDFDKKKLMKNLLGFRFVTAGIFFGVAPFVALLFPYPGQVKIAIALSTISFLAVSMNQVLIGYYQTTLKMHLQVIGEIAGRIVLVIGLYLFIANGAGFLPLMGILVLSSIVYTAILWIRATKETAVGFAFNWLIWKAIMTKMWPIALSIMFNVVYLKGDIVLLSILRSQTEVGIYGAAYRIIDILSQLAMMLMGILLPLLAYAWSRNLKDQFREHYQQAFDLMMMIAIPMTIGTILTAKKITPLFGSELTAAAEPLQILALALFGVYLGAVFGHMAVAINKQKQTIWIYLSSAVITLGGYLLFIPRFGISGAAWMSVFSELYTGLLLFGVIRHYSHNKLSYTTWWKITFAALLMSTGILLTDHLSLFLIIPIAMGVYAAALYFTKAVSKETLREIFVFNH